MGVISRLYNFVVGTTIDSEQVDAEFNQILGVLNGSIDPANLSAASKNSFLKLNSVADKKIAFGMATMTFSGDWASSLLSITHGLGVVPQVILTFPQLPSDNIADAVVIGQWGGASTSAFSVRGRTTSGAVIGPGTIGVYWIAIG